MSMIFNLLQGSTPKSPGLSKKKIAKRKVPRKGKQSSELLSPESASKIDDIFDNTEKLYKVFSTLMLYIVLFLDEIKCQ